jgi:uncharacterized protein (TIGR02265 family)
MDGKVYLADPAQWVDGSLLEGLFLKGLTVDSELEVKLRQVGYDIRRTEPRYRQQVFERCIAVAGTHLFPDKKPAQAQRELGRRLVDGFAKTVLGSVMLAVLPHVPPRIIVNRLPRWFNATAPGSTAHIEMVGPTERRMSMPNQPGIDPMPHLLCGVLERLIRGWTAIEVVSSGGSETVYRIAWK